jgi:hypothetical protein
MPTSTKPCIRTPEEQIGYLLKRLMHQFRHQVEERLRRGCDMSLAHLVTLDQLQQEPGIAGARLARRLLKANVNNFFILFNLILMTSLVLFSTANCIE